MLEIEWMEICCVKWNSGTFPDEKETGTWTFLRNRNRKFPDLYYRILEHSELNIILESFGKNRSGKFREKSFRKVLEQGSENIRNILYFFKRKSNKL